MNEATIRRTAQGEGPNTESVLNQIRAVTVFVGERPYRFDLPKIRQTFIDAYNILVDVEFEQLTGQVRE